MLVTDYIYLSGDTYLYYACNWIQR